MAGTKCLVASGPAAEELRERLIGAGLLVPTSVDGLYGRAERFESVVEALSEMAHGLGAGQEATLLSFPPVMPTRVIESTGYLSSFPNLLGVVRTFSGSDREHARLLRNVDTGGDWSGQYHASDVILCPATCHPLYPMCTGRLPAGGRRFEVSGYCFRYEPSRDPMRMLAFRQREYAYLGEACTAAGFRDRWVEAGRRALCELGLEVSTGPANDPFFGRAGELLADYQRQEALKTEILVVLPGYAGPTALASGNLHKDHFASQFGIEAASGEVAHSSCFGFGLERIAIALLATHGLDPAGWPPAVRSRLWA